MEFSSGFMKVSLVILLIVTENKSAPNKKSDHDVYQLAREQFFELLDTIANVNKERMYALKRYNDLDKNKVATGILRYIDDKSEDPLVALRLNDNNPEAVIDVLHKIISGSDSNKSEMNTFLRYMPRLLTEYYDDNFSGEMKTYERRGQINVNDRINEKLHITKKYTENDVTKDCKEKSKPTADTDKENILRGSSWKKRAKRCRKACKNAFKSVCREYKCTSGMKKMMKKRCKSECEHEMD